MQHLSMRFKSFQYTKQSSAVHHSRSKGCLVLALARIIGELPGYMHVNI